MFLRVMQELEEYVSITIVFYGHICLLLHNIFKLGFQPVGFSKKKEEFVLCICFKIITVHTKNYPLCYIKSLCSFVSTCTDIF
jgi:hypothetical protein